MYYNMKPKRQHIDYLNDIFDTINKGLSFVENMTYEEFCNDDKTQFALIRALEIIGEASKKIPSEIKSEYSAIPWLEMMGMRDILIHDYFGVNIKVIWETAKKDLPDLKEKIRKLVENK